MELPQTGSAKNNDSLLTVAEIEEIDFSKFMDRPPRPLNMDRKRLFVEALQFFYMIIL